MSLLEKKSTSLYGYKKATVYVCDISYLHDLPGVELLTPMRRERMFRYRLHEDRARCLVAGLMLRCVFGGTQAESIMNSSLGKPFLPSGPFFNLSHSGSKVVLLVGEQELGIDIEQITPYSQQVARRVFTDCELEWLDIQQSDEAFFRLWTGKESIMKALGQGFQLPPESFEISPTQAVPNNVCGRDWFLHWQVLEGHVLCCASSSANIKYKTMTLNREDLLKKISGGVFYVHQNRN